MKTIQIAPNEEDCRIDGHRIIGTMGKRTIVCTIPSKYSMPADETARTWMIRNFCQAIAMASKSWQAERILNDAWKIEGGENRGIDRCNHKQQKAMKTAKFKLGDVIVQIPAEYLEQQTCKSSVFENVPADMVDRDALIEANKTNGVTWYLVKRDVDSLHISVPTDLIEWEE